MEYAAKVLSNRPIAPDCYQMTFALQPAFSPKICKAIQPGQFVHLGLNHPDILLRRPFSIYDLPDRNKISIVYQAVGKGTKLMSRLKSGSPLNILGPLGKGFAVNKTAKHSILVGGGIGIAGLHLLLKMIVLLPHKITVLVGARSKKQLYCLADLKKLCRDVSVATEDGSAGTKGLVTALLAKQELSDCQLYTCGPNPMMDAVRKIALSHNVPAQLSLETRMACGIGLCRACVCKVVAEPQRRRSPNATSGQWATVCEQGPVFDAKQLYEPSNPSSRLLAGRQYNRF